MTPIQEKGLLLKHGLHLFIFCNLFAGGFSLCVYFTGLKLRFWEWFGIYSALVFVLFLLGVAASFYEFHKQRSLSEFPDLESDFKYYSRLPAMRARGTVSRSELVRYHAEYRHEFEVERARRGLPADGDVYF